MLQGLFSGTFSLELSCLDSASLAAAIPNSTFRRCLLRTRMSSPSALLWRESVAGALDTAVVTATGGVAVPLCRGCSGAAGVSSSAAALFWASNALARASAAKAAAIARERAALRASRAAAERASPVRGVGGWASAVWSTMVGDTKVGDSNDVEVSVASLSEKIWPSSMEWTTSGSFPCRRATSSMPSRNPSLASGSAPELPNGSVLA
mmetsp:Transcript_15944/g.34907  ORF Transcript_15944/g.34907 Transcript_15944/m.34907 type:complete len:208 (-) Transcript_15944:910-1533(-)